MAGAGHRDEACGLGGHGLGGQQEGHDPRVKQEVPEVVHACHQPTEQD